MIIVWDTRCIYLSFFKPVSPEPFPRPMIPISRTNFQIFWNSVSTMTTQLLLITLGKTERGPPSHHETQSAIVHVRLWAVISGCSQRWQTGPLSPAQGNVSTCLWPAQVREICKSSIHAPHSLQQEQGVMSSEATRKAGTRARQDLTAPSQQAPTPEQLDKMSKYKVFRLESMSSSYLCSQMT